MSALAELLGCEQRAATGDDRREVIDETEIPQIERLDASGLLAVANASQRRHGVAHHSLCGYEPTSGDRLGRGMRLVAREWSERDREECALLIAHLSDYNLSLARAVDLLLELNHCGQSEEPEEPDPGEKYHHTTVGRRAMTQSPALASNHGEEQLAREHRRPLVR